MIGRVSVMRTAAVKCLLAGRSVAGPAFMADVASRTVAGVL
jgi:hypothetical protein